LETLCDRRCSTDRCGGCVDVNPNGGAMGQQFVDYW
jgi:hypothetical protein